MTVRTLFGVTILFGKAKLPLQISAGVFRCEERPTQWCEPACVVHMGVRCFLLAWCKGWCSTKRIWSGIEPWCLVGTSEHGYMAYMGTNLYLYLCVRVMFFSVLEVGSSEECEH